MIELMLAAILLQPTHPCDLPDQGVPTKGTAVGWCHDMKDDGGLILQTLSFRINVNGTITDLGSVPPIGNPNSNGYYYFQVPISSSGLGRGMYPVYVEAYIGSEISLPSNIVTWQIGGPPNKPIKPRIP